MAKYIIAADQGTTSSRAVLFDENREVVDITQRELTQYYPREGWVEHDPREIYATQYGVIAEVVAKNGIDPRDIAAIGVANQRETVVVWDKNTGEAVCNAIVWQCRRTANICEQLVKDGFADHIRDTTGLIIDAYFSATKIKWILDHIEGAREKARDGNLLAGTVDSWLIYNFTGKTVHVTDRTNASRTMLYDINKLRWDKELCDALDIPMQMLPEVKSSSEVYGFLNLSGVDIPIAGIAGDQQAALFGQKCFTRGSMKNTYGTGCFLLMNTGEEAIKSKYGLLTTIAATADASVQYALEGSVFVAGAVVQWLRDELGLIKNAAETEALAKAVSDTAGVYMVPAFTGLGAPYWDMYARGTIVGITRGANKNHLVRAALESIAFQSDSVIKAMEQDSGEKITELKTDGGASANGFLMQFQADISGVTVRRPAILESTALGAADLAGRAVGLFADEDMPQTCRGNDDVFIPKMPEEERSFRRREFERAVKRACSWEEKEKKQ